MSPTKPILDPLVSVPEPGTIRELIAAHVSRTELLRQLLRLSVRCHRDKSVVSTPCPRVEGVSDASR